MISRDRLIAASLTSLMCQWAHNKTFSVLILCPSIIGWSVLLSFWFSSFKHFCIFVDDTKFITRVCHYIQFSISLFFCFLFYFFRLILTRKLWHSYNTLCVTLLHGAFSRCYVATFRVKSLWLKLVGSSAAAEHTSQAFLDVTFKQRVRNWIDSRV